MSIGPLKTQGFNQGIYEISATKKERLGTLRVTEDGRFFRYARAGETLVQGKVCQSSEVDAQHFAETGDAIAKGSTQVSLVVGSTAVTANMFDDGYLQIYDGETGTVGMQYKISSHTTCDASGTVILQLDEPILVAVISTDSWSLIPNLWNKVTHNAAVAHGFAGIAVVPVTSDYYCWLQTGGPGIGLAEATIALGAEIVPGATEGSVKVAPDGASDSAMIGYTYSIASVQAKYCPIMLTVD